MQLAQIDFEALEGESVPELAGGKIGDVVGRLLTLIFPIVGIVLLVYLLSAGFQLMTSAGDPKKIQAARGALINALIGFVIIFAAYWITQALGFALGLEQISNMFGGG